MTYFISHSFSLLLDLSIRVKSQVLIIFTKALELLFPPFEALNTKDYIGSFIKFDTLFFVQNIGYSMMYLVLILFFTILIFNKKN